MYEKSFRMRGKTYDYKVLYESVKKFMVLPKPDDVHTLICLGLDPPLRQGQTRYPFIVMQFKSEDEREIDINMPTCVLSYPTPWSSSDQLQGNHGRKIPETETTLRTPDAFDRRKPFPRPGRKESSVARKGVFQAWPPWSREPSALLTVLLSHHSQAGVKCSIKANEGLLYCLEKAFMFVPKPAQYIQFDNVAVIVMSRVGGAVSASRTFDITVTLKGGAGEHQFSNINRYVRPSPPPSRASCASAHHARSEEQKPLEEFFNAKGLKTRNEMLDDVRRPSGQAAFCPADSLAVRHAHRPSPQRRRHGFL
jgi:structure-specific recognition protein 1